MNIPNSDAIFIIGNKDHTFAGSNPMILWPLSSRPEISIPSTQS